MVQIPCNPRHFMPDLCIGINLPYAELCLGIAKVLNGHGSVDERGAGN
jgi:hypothetical protein